MLCPVFRKHGGGHSPSLPESSVVSDSEEMVRSRVTQVPLIKTQNIIPRTGPEHGILRGDNEAAWCAWAAARGQLWHPGPS